MKILNFFAAILILGAMCSCSEEDITIVDETSSTVVQACSFYIDNGSHSYFQCTDYAGNGLSNEAVESACDLLTAGEVSTSCPISGLLLGADDSTGKCDAIVSGDTVVRRWYYSTVGDAPSEAALCTTISGTFTAD